MYVETKEIQVTSPTSHPCLPKWRARIDAAERRGYFNNTDELMAKNWDRCAIGEVLSTFTSQQVPREIPPGGTLVYPKDDTLVELGIEFTGGVRARKSTFAEAREILTAIETRLGEIFGSTP